MEIMFFGTNTIIYTRDGEEYKLSLFYTNKSGKNNYLFVKDGEEYKLSL